MQEPSVQTNRDLTSAEVVQLTQGMSSYNEINQDDNMKRFISAAIYANRLPDNKSQLLKQNFIHELVEIAAKNNKLEYCPHGGRFTLVMKKLADDAGFLSADRVFELVKFFDKYDPDFVKAPEFISIRGVFDSKQDEISCHGGDVALTESFCNGLVCKNGTSTPIAFLEILLQHTDVDSIKHLKANLREWMNRNQ